MGLTIIMSMKSASPFSHTPFNPKCQLLSAFHNAGDGGSPSSSWGEWSGPSWGLCGWNCGWVPWSCPPGRRRTGSLLSARTAPRCHGPPGHPWCFEQDVLFCKQCEKWISFLTAHRVWFTWRHWALWAKNINNTCSFPSKEKLYSCVTGFQLRVVGDLDL